MSIPKVSVRQIKAARALLAWSQNDLAEASGVSEPTIKRLEARDDDLGGAQDTRDKIRAALEIAGVQFTNGGQPGVKMSEEKTRGVIYDDKRPIAVIRDGEVFSDTDGRKVAVVNRGNLHDPETGEFICGLAALGIGGSPISADIQRRLRGEPK